MPLQCYSWVTIRAGLIMLLQSVSYYIAGIETVSFYCINYFYIKISVVDDTEESCSS